MHITPIPKDVIIYLCFTSAGGGEGGAPKRHSQCEVAAERHKNDRKISITGQTKKNICQNWSDASSEPMSRRAGHPEDTCKSQTPDQIMCRSRTSPPPPPAPHHSPLMRTGRSKEQIHPGIPRVSQTPPPCPSAGRAPAAPARLPRHHRYPPRRENEAGASCPPCGTLRRMGGGHKGKGEDGRGGEGEAWLGTEILAGSRRW